MGAGVVFVRLWGCWGMIWACFWVVVAAPCFPALVSHAVVITQAAGVDSVAAGFLLSLSLPGILRFGALTQLLAFTARFIHPLPIRDVTMLRATSACGVSRR